MIHDLRRALRSLRRSPGVALAACLSLVLGIGANTAIFSFVDGLLLDPLPYEDGDRLVFVWEAESTEDDRRSGPTSLATYRDMSRDTRRVEPLEALLPLSFSLTSQDPPESLFSRRVTAGYFELYGIEPILGRTFTEREAEDGERLVVLSHGAWGRLFGSDRKVVGRPIELDGEAYRVVGVMPEFYSPIEPAPVQLWAPLTLGTTELPRQQRNLAVYGRLADGATLESAREEVTRLVADLGARHPEDMEGRAGRVERVRDVLVGDVRGALLLLWAAGGAVLLIACGNVAHLLLVHAYRRQRDMGVHLALGASRRDMTRLLVVESALLSLAGAGGGLLLAQAILQYVKTLVPVAFGLPRLDPVGIDGGVVLFTLATTALVTLLFSLAPLVIGFRTDLRGVLETSSGRATAGRRSRLVRRFLTTSEIASALALLAAVGFMIQTLRDLEARPVAREPDQLLTVRTSLRGDEYQDPARRVAFFERTQDEVSALPGVVAVGATDLIPLAPNIRGDGRFRVEGSEPPPGEEPTALVQIVTPEYFDALGVAILRGRSFDTTDRADTRPVAVINQRMAESVLADGDPVGRRLILLDAPEEPVEIVGVVEDVRTHVAPPDPVATLYVPQSQRAARIMTFLVRTRGSPDEHLQRVTERIARIDPLTSTYGAVTVAEQLAIADWRPHFALRLLGLLAGLALLLAMTGTYAVLSAGTAERTRELSVRVAFGASRSSILGLVLRDTLRLALLGLGLGLLASLGLVRLLRSQLYGTGAITLPILLGSTLLLAAVILAAGLLPAVRASRVLPAAVLREK